MASRAQSNPSRSVNSVLVFDVSFPFLPASSIFVVFPPPLPEDDEFPEEVPLSAYFCFFTRAENSS